MSGTTSLFQVEGELNEFTEIIDKLDIKNAYNYKTPYIFGASPNEMNIDINSPEFQEPVSTYLRLIYNNGYIETDIPKDKWKNFVKLLTHGEKISIRPNVFRQKPNESYKIILEK
jgi:hypothetical protein